MEVVSRDGYGLLLLVGEFDFGGVEIDVEVGAYGESFGGCGVGDEVDDGLVGSRGRPRQLPVILEKSLCSILFHLLVPGG